tara:strand:+ start:698 stop:1024 length:327 start_codon:yes stop_codon:yes gene_type:complete
MKVLYFKGDVGEYAQIFPADRLTAITNRGSDADFDLWFSNSDGQTTDHQIRLITVGTNSGKDLQSFFAWLVANPSGGTPQDKIYEFVGGSLNSYGNVLLNTTAFTFGS